MPTYDYKCNNCNNEFEVLQSISDEPLKLCPKCDTLNLVRLFSAGGGLIFKGNGFYLTDYKKTTNDKKNSPPKDTTPPKTNT